MITRRWHFTETDRHIFKIAIAIAAAITVIASARVSLAVDVLAYSFETLDVNGFPDGFHNNGGGTTVTQDSIGATDGTKSMKVAIHTGATFVGAQTENFGTAFGDPPGLDHVHFDLTIVQRFDIPNPSPPPDRLGFARIGVVIFGVTQPDFPSGQFGVQIQTDPVQFELPIGALEPGTYRDQRIDLHELLHPLTFELNSFDEIIGTQGSGQNDIIPTSWEFYFNKTGDGNVGNFPLTLYIDNVRFGHSVPGDYNGNDVVDAADYVLWRNFGPGPPPKPPLRNEVDTPGTVNAADYTAWRARFGNNAAAGSGLDNAAVPEPGGAVLLIVAGLLWWMRGRGR